MAILAGRPVNRLVLDEPTNHPDLEAIEQPELALEDDTGTLLLVRHDRRMLERVSARLSEDRAETTNRDGILAPVAERGMPRKPSVDASGLGFSKRSWREVE